MLKIPQEIIDETIKNTNDLIIPLFDKLRNYSIKTLLQEPLENDLTRLLLLLFGGILFIKFTNWIYKLNEQHDFFR